MTNYAKSISQVHYRKGSLLEYNGVYLTEGPWPAKAYFDARRRARSRSAALYIDYGFTYPRVFSQGPTKQVSGKPMGAEEQTGQGPSRRGRKEAVAIRSRSLAGAATLGPPSRAAAHRAAAACQPRHEIGGERGEPRKL